MVGAKLNVLAFLAKLALGFVFLLLFSFYQIDLLKSTRISQF